MEQQLKAADRERVVAGGLALLGMGALAASILRGDMIVLQLRELLLAVLFTAGIVAGDLFPIHILRGTKASVINLPIFLSAVLLPAPTAILVAGSGLLISNLIARRERGLYPRDIIAIVGQWMFTVFIGSVVLHPPQTGFLARATPFELLLLCALVFLLIDFSLFSLSQSLSSGEPMLATFKSTLREGMTFEAIQYLIAIVGALAVREEIWSIVLIIIPILITYTAFKNRKEMHLETARILEDMADTVDLRDVYTGGHSKRVAEWARKILTQLDIAGPEAMMIETAARLHDIGKIGLPDSILKKPGRLLPEEIPVMQTHTQKGADLIEKYKDFSRGAVMIKHHHERWDGDGYPSRLKNYEIPFGARVIAVADAFDAMTSDRPYRAAMTTQQAIKILLAGRDSQWDGRVVDALVQAVIEELKEDAAQVHALYRLVTSASG